MRNIIVFAKCIIIRNIAPTKVILFRNIVHFKCILFRNIVPTKGILFRNIVPLKVYFSGILSPQRVYFSGILSPLRVYFSGILFPLRVYCSGIFWSNIIPAIWVRLSWLSENICVHIWVNWLFPGLHSRSIHCSSKIQPVLKHVYNNIIIFLTTNMLNKYYLYGYIMWIICCEWLTPTRLARPYSQL